MEHKPAVVWAGIPAFAAFFPLHSPCHMFSRNLTFGDSSVLKSSQLQMKHNLGCNSEIEIDSEIDSVAKN